MTALRDVPLAPGNVPLLGHTIALLRDPMGFLAAIGRTGEVVRVNLGTRPVIFVTSPELIRHITTTHARRLEKGRLFDRLRVLVGDGLATASNTIHRRHRRIMQPLFNKDAVTAHGDIFDRAARSLSESWTDGQVVDVQQTMLRLTIGTLDEALLSTRLDRGTIEAIRDDLQVIFKNMLARTMSPPLFDRIPLIPANRRFNAASVRLHGVVARLLADPHADDPDHTDMLSLLLRTRRNGSAEALTDQEIRDELCSLLVAGAETQASTLAWAFHEIARRPDIEQRLTEEIEPAAANGPITPSRISELPYTLRVINEVTRLYAVTLLMRRTIEPLRLGGVELPEGVEVAFSLYSLHRDHRYFPEPELMDPDRWLPGAHRAPCLGAFLPFGAGNRKCIGDTFAMTQIPIVLATIFSKWRLSHYRTRDVRTATAGFPYPKDLKMVVRRKPIDDHGAR